MTNQLIMQVLHIVFSSTRGMPAHFCSNGDRSQSFCISFDKLTAADDEAMASAAWRAFTSLPSDPGETELQSNLVLKCGEDIMIGAYVITKLGGQDLIGQMEAEVLAHEIELFDSMIENAEEVLSCNLAQEYFEYCRTCGNELALQNS